MNKVLMFLKTKQYEIRYRRFQRHSKNPHIKMKKLGWWIPPQNR